jgi:hypothetical protein
VLWHENYQFSADSIQCFLQNDQISRTDLFSSAFVIAKEEDSPLYNQIKGNNMVAYFRNNDIYRFDVLSAAEAIFCIREENLITSLNKRESKEAMTITLKERQVQRFASFVNIKSTAYPLYDLSEQERLLSNFNWRIDERPKDRFDITSRLIHPTAVDQFGRIAQPTFSYTQQYFPEHILPKPIERKKQTTHTETTERITPEPINVSFDTLVIPPPQLQRDSLLSQVVSNLQRDTILQPVQEFREIAEIPFETQELSQAAALTKKEIRAQRRAERKRLKAERRREKRERRRP